MGDTLVNHGRWHVMMWVNGARSKALHEEKFTLEELSFSAQAKLFTKLWKSSLFVLL